MCPKEVKFQETRPEKGAKNVSTLWREAQQLIGDGGLAVDVFMITLKPVNVTRLVSKTAKIANNKNERDRLRRTSCDEDCAVAIVEAGWQTGCKALAYFRRRKWSRRQTGSSTKLRA
jgi:hypothetical protein